MKILPVLAAAILGTFGVAAAQTTVVSSSAPIEAAGTITTFTPGQSIIVNSSDGTPVTYGYSSSTTLVDDAGNPVSAEVVKSGLPVTVYYSNVNGQMMASKMIVRRQATTATTTTTTTNP